MSDNGKVVLKPRNEEVTPRYGSDYWRDSGRSPSPLAPRPAPEPHRRVERRRDERHGHIALKPFSGSERERSDASDRGHSRRVVMHSRWTRQNRAEPRLARQKKREDEPRREVEPLRREKGILRRPPDEHEEAEEALADEIEEIDVEEICSDDGYEAPSEEAGMSPSPSDEGVPNFSGVTPVEGKGGTTAESAPQSPVSPESVGSSVLGMSGDEIRQQQPASGSADAESGMGASPGAKGQRMKRVRRRPRVEAGVEAPAAGPAAISASTTAQDFNNRQKRRRVSKRAAETDPVALSQQGATPVAARRTAAKSLPGTPPPTLAAPPSSGADLSESEQQELLVSVKEHLKRHVTGGRAEEAEVLAEFISVLLDQKKSSEELVTELNIMDEEAKPFVSWLEKQKAALISRRPPPTTPRRVPVPPPSLVRPAAVPATVPKPAAPLHVQTQDVPASGAPKLAAQLRPNPVTASLEESKVKKPLVVITEKLVLQPNPAHGLPGDAASGDERDYSQLNLSPAEKRKLEEQNQANQKKMELLADMTAKLQVILKRLSDKNLDDATKERYQSLAQTIQAQMAALSKPSAAERAWSEWSVAAEKATSPEKPENAPAEKSSTSPGRPTVIDLA
eukprot:TRINITY_DN25024_c0_g1_i1.p1 TRINITY_DN25024_c0_g1~~TRINITY_DN25024_c0_g1_i1.p1  ORF type:complete len:622 (+),score=151.54 TRINITY_DN25024_c0_g1_i1:68-1933(+)